MLVTLNTFHTCNHWRHIGLCNICTAVSNQSRKHILTNSNITIKHLPHLSLTYDSLLFIKSLIKGIVLEFTHASTGAYTCISCCLPLSAPVNVQGEVTKTQAAKKSWRSWNAATSLFIQKSHQFPSSLSRGQPCQLSWDRCLCSGLTTSRQKP